MEVRMTKHSPHKRYKGHCALCGHYKGQQGDSWYGPVKVMRKLGVNRRYRRNKAYGED
jgi:hypothetical protein